MTQVDEGTVAKRATPVLTSMAGQETKFDPGRSQIERGTTVPSAVRSDRATDASVSSPGPCEPPSPESLTSGLMLMDVLEQLGRPDGAVLRLVERASGMRLGQIRVLRTVLLGGRSQTVIAETIGEHPHAVAATLETLEELDYVAVSVVGGVQQVAATEAGRARVDQLGGLLVRLHADGCSRGGDELVAAAELLIEDMERSVGDWLADVTHAAGASCVRSCGSGEGITRARCYRSRDAQIPTGSNSTGTSIAMSSAASSPTTSSRSGP